jgi:hypothetical protein
MLGNICEVRFRELLKGCRREFTSPRIKDLDELDEFMMSLDSMLFMKPRQTYLSTSLHLQG